MSYMEANKRYAALGVDTVDAGALALSNCTFRYTGEAATVTRPWALTGAFPAVFDIVGDLTFADFRIALKQGDNGIVKTGAGALDVAAAGLRAPSDARLAVLEGSVRVDGDAAIKRAFRLCNFSWFDCKHAFNGVAHW